MTSILFSLWACTVPAKVINRPMAKRTGFFMRPELKIEHQRQENAGTRINRLRSQVEDVSPTHSKGKSRKGHIHIQPQSGIRPYSVAMSGKGTIRYLSFSCTCVQGSVGEQGNPPRKLYRHIQPGTCPNTEPAGKNPCLRVGVHIDYPVDADRGPPAQ